MIVDEQTSAEVQTPESKTDTTPPSNLSKPPPSEPSCFAI